MKPEQILNATMQLGRSLARGFAVAFTAALLCAQGCERGTAPASTVSGAAAQQPPASATKSRLDAFIEADLPPADGFDLPLAGGWRVAAGYCSDTAAGVHPGEDWEPDGAERTSPDVRAVANGRVVAAGDFGAAWGNVVAVDHLFYENNDRKTLRSVYACLADLRVRPGEDVRRGQTLGTAGSGGEGTKAPRLHVEFQTDGDFESTFGKASATSDEAWVREHLCDPSAFVAGHRSLLVPQNEDALLIIDPSAGAMRLYNRGRRRGEYQVGMGQAPGQKRIRDDLKTPRGMYFVVQKSRGPFEGPYADYYGGFWMRINYPNAYDAAWGRANGLVTAEQERAIAAAWSRRQPTLQGTRLGDGIGMHGWKGEWSNDGPRGLS